MTRYCPTPALTKAYARPLTVLTVNDTGAPARVIELTCCEPASNGIMICSPLEPVPGTTLNERTLPDQVIGPNGLLCNKVIFLRKACNLGLHEKSPSKLVR